MFSERDRLTSGLRVARADRQFSSRGRGGSAESRLGNGVGESRSRSLTRAD